MTTDLTPIRTAGTILLTSYKRDGSPVSTPVSVAFDGDRAFFRTYDKAWKVRRLRRNPEVELVPCTFRGRAAGQPVRARATLLDEDQASVAAAALARRHPVLQGVLVPLAHRLKKYQTLHYELTGFARPAKLSGTRR